MNTILDSKKTRAILWIIGGFAVVLVVFGAGMVVGYRQGVFASHFGKDYLANFRGGVSMMADVLPGGPPPLNQYGMAGTVLGVDPSSSVISVEGPSGDEGWVVVNGGTMIREENRTISLRNVVPGNTIVVIGDPNGQGQVLARFIRIFTGSSSIPQMTTMVQRIHVPVSASTCIVTGQ